MLNINDYLTYMGEEKDVVFLRSKLLPVNMRLYKSSKGYKKIIQECCNYIEWTMEQRFKGYNNPLSFGLLGISGANLAIPFNIIGILGNYEMVPADKKVVVMMNPNIIDHSLDTVVNLERCGSLRLKEVTKVKRHKWITVEWNNPANSGIYTVTKFDFRSNSPAIEHEVDHNLGILITD